MSPARPDAVLLAWDPELHDRWAGGHRTAAEAAAVRGRALGYWPVGRRRNLAPGTEAWFLIRGTRPGIIGHGATMAMPAVDETGQWFVTVTADALLPAGDQLPLEQVLRETGWQQPPPSGAAVQAADVAVLRRLWQAHLPSRLLPDPLLAVPGSRPPAALRHAAVDRWEHDPELRRLCLGYHGTGCAACGFSFEATYGPLAGGYIQVHRLDPGEGAPDPVSGLVPLCPNCHAVAHLAGPDALSPAELRRLIAEHGHLPGQVLDDGQLAAREFAGRLLQADGEAAP